MGMTVDERAAERRYEDLFLQLRVNSEVHEHNGTRWRVMARYGRAQYGAAATHDVFLVAKLDPEGKRVTGEQMLLTLTNRFGGRFCLAKIEVSGRNGEHKDVVPLSGFARSSKKKGAQA